MQDSRFLTVGGVSQKFGGRRDTMFTREQLADINTYENWGDVVPAFDLFEQVFDSEGRPLSRDDARQAVVTNGRYPASQDYAATKSIFNKFSTVFLGDNSDLIRKTNNVPLVDSPETRKDIKAKSDCSIKNLVALSQEGQLGRATYDYSDFAFCKYLGRMSNNYMVTLRRFPMPVPDNISNPYIDKNDKFMKFPVQMGCLVTWMGTPGNELSSILKYDVSMPFEENTAKMEEGGVDADASSAPLNAFFSTFNPKYQKQVALGQAGGAIAPYMPGFLRDSLERPPYHDQLAGTHDSNKLWGPIDSIKKIYRRSDTDGIVYNQSFSLTFDFELRSYSNINTRQAMLDLLANILCVTYTTGDFWGGGYRGGGASQSSIFSNLECMKTSGGVTDFIESFHKDIGTVTSKAQSSISSQGGIIQTIKNFLNNFGGMLIGGMLNKLGRPQKAMVNSLLTDTPVGLWHVTVGNPLHPIMSMGNMILKKATIEHYGPLGLDDFPTGIRVTCELDRGRSRDRREIERMYMHGMNRIYSGMGKEVEYLYDKAKEYNHGRIRTNSTARGLNEDNAPNLSDMQQSLEGIAKDVLAAANKIVAETKSPDDLFKKQKVLKKYFGTDNKDYIIMAGGETDGGSQKRKKSSAVSKNTK